MGSLFTNLVLQEGTVSKENRENIIRDISET